MVNIICYYACGDILPTALLASRYLPLPAAGKFGVINCY